jgi:hypothetical protein
MEIYADHTSTLPYKIGRRAGHHNPLAVFGNQAIHGSRYSTGNERLRAIAVESTPCFEPGKDGGKVTAKFAPIGRFGGISGRVLTKE